MFKHIKASFSNTKKLAKKQPKSLHYEELEQRVLFSADVVPGLDSIAVEEQVLVEDVNRDVQAERQATPKRLSRRLPKHVGNWYWSTKTWPITNS